LEYLDVTLPDLAANLALDEALLLQAEAGTGPEMLRFWEWPGPAVVLGAGCRVSDDVHEAACQADGVPLLRRSSGGGTVLLGPGCLLFSLVLAYERSPFLNEVRPSYRYILGHVATGLETLAAGIRVAGISDLAVAGRKFSGNAQQRKRRYLLHHGTLLYEFAIDRVSRYLHPPARQPEYRGGRPHDTFLTNLPATAAQLKTVLRTAWDAQQAASQWPEESVRRLTEEKYARPEWVRRR
jgi:lipoate-protein ligase A